MEACPLQEQRWACWGILHRLHVRIQTVGSQVGSHLRRGCAEASRMHIPMHGMCVCMPCTERACIVNLAKHQLAHGLPAEARRDDSNPRL